MADSYKLKPESLEITGSDLHLLYEGALEFLYSLRHDLSNPLSAVVTEMQTAIRVYQQLSEILIPMEPAHQVEQALGLLKETLDGARDALGRFRNIVRTLLPHASRGDSTLVAKPSRIVAEIAEIFGPKMIELSSSGPQELEILFPQMLLSSLMYELVANAVHASQSPKVGISWTQRHHLFVLVIRDSGPGFPGIEPATSVPIDELQLGRLSGLGFWNRAIGKMGGVIFIGRSSSMGGAKVTVQIPVRAYYSESEDSNGRIYLSTY